MIKKVLYTENITYLTGNLGKNDNTISTTALSFIEAFEFARSNDADFEFKEISKALNLDYLDLFFHVGEDFELLFTIPKSLEKTLKDKMDFYAIGEIIEENTVEIVLSNGKTKEISPRGYEHLN